MTRSFSILNMLSVLVFAAISGAALLVALQGPTYPLPVHFNFEGIADRWGDRVGVGLTLAGLAGLELVLALGMGWTASRAEPGSSRRRGLDVAQVVVVASFAALTALILFLSLSGGGAEAPRGAMMAGLGLLFAVIGAFLGRVGPNPFVGVRTPWSYKSRRAWDRSNRLAGRLFFLGGLAAMVAAPLAPQPLGVAVLIVGVLIAAAWSVLESWRVWRVDPDRQPF
jgi:hypothetical protein